MVYEVREDIKKITHQKRLQEVRYEEKLIAQQKAELYRRFIEDRKKMKVQQKRQAKILDLKSNSESMVLHMQQSLCHVGEAHRLAKAEIQKSKELQEAKLSQKEFYTVETLKRNQEATEIIREQQQELYQRNITKYLHYNFRKEHEREDRENAHAYGEHKQVVTSTIAPRNRSPKRITQSAELVHHRFPTTIQATVIRSEHSNSIINDAERQEKLTRKSTWKGIMTELTNKNKIKKRAKEAKVVIRQEKEVRELESELQHLYNIDHQFNQHQKREIHYAVDQAGAMMKQKAFEKVFMATAYPKLTDNHGTSQRARAIHDQKNTEEDKIAHEPENSPRYPQMYYKNEQEIEEDTETEIEEEEEEEQEEVDDHLRQELPVQWQQWTQSKPPSPIPPHAHAHLSQYSISPRDDNDYHQYKHTHQQHYREKLQQQQPPVSQQQQSMHRPAVQQQENQQWIHKLQNQQQSWKQWQPQVPAPAQKASEYKQPQTFPSKPSTTTAVIPTASMLYHSSEDIDTSMETEDEDEEDDDIEEEVKIMQQKEEEEEFELEDIHQDQDQEQEKHHIAPMNSDYDYDKHAENIDNRNAANNKDVVSTKSTSEAKFAMPLPPTGPVTSELAQQFNSESETDYSRYNETAEQPPKPWMNDIETVSFIPHDDFQVPQPSVVQGQQDQSLSTGNLYSDKASSSSSSTSSTQSFSGVVPRAITAANAVLKNSSLNSMKMKSVTVAASYQFTTSDEDEDGDELNHRSSLSSSTTSSIFSPSTHLLSTPPRNTPALLSSASNSPAVSVHSNSSRGSTSNTSMNSEEKKVQNRFANKLTSHILQEISMGLDDESDEEDFKAYFVAASSTRRLNTPSSRELTASERYLVQETSPNSSESSQDILIRNKIDETAEEEKDEVNSSSGSSINLQSLLSDSSSYMLSPSRGNALTSTATHTPQHRTSSMATTTLSSVEMKQSHSLYTTKYSTSGMTTSSMSGTLPTTISPSTPPSISSNSPSKQSSSSGSGGSGSSGSISISEILRSRGFVYSPTASPIASPQLSSLATTTIATIASVSQQYPSTITSSTILPSSLLSPTTSSSSSSSSSSSRASLVRTATVSSTIPTVPVMHTAARDDTGFPKDATFQEIQDEIHSIRKRLLSTVSLSTTSSVSPHSRSPPSSSSNSNGTSTVSSPEEGFAVSRPMASMNTTTSHARITPFPPSTTTTTTTKTSMNTAILSLQSLTQLPPTSSSSSSSSASSSSASSLSDLGTAPTSYGITPPSIYQQQQQAYQHDRTSSSILSSPFLSTNTESSAPKDHTKSMHMTANISVGSLLTDEGEAEEETDGGLREYTNSSIFSSLEEQILEEDLLSHHSLPNPIHYNAATTVTNTNMNMNTRTTLTTSSTTTTAATATATGNQNMAYSLHTPSSLLYPTITSNTTSSSPLLFLQASSAYSPTPSDSTFSSTTSFTRDANVSAMGSDDEDISIESLKKRMQELSSYSLL